MRLKLESLFQHTRCTSKNTICSKILKTIFNSEVCVWKHKYHPTYHHVSYERRTGSRLAGAAGTQSTQERVLCARYTRQKFGERPVPIRFVTGRCRFDGLFKQWIVSVSRFPH